MPRCPVCDEPVSAPETECPKCGIEFRSQKERRKLSRTAITLVIVLGFFGVAGTVACVNLYREGWARAHRSVSRNNLNEIGLALQNYHAQEKSLPTGGVFREDGSGQHGWMTSILPFMDQAPLYGQVDFSSPWDAPRHRPVFQTPVASYLSPFGTRRMSDDGYALSHYAGNVLILGKNQFLKFEDITDGQTNTILAGEVGPEFKPWGSPENMRHPRDFGRPDGKGIDGHVVLLIDGSARYMSGQMDPQILDALATPSGNEAIGDW